MSQCPLLALSGPAERRALTGTSCRSALRRPAERCVEGLCRGHRDSSGPAWGISALIRTRQAPDWLTSTPAGGFEMRIANALAAVLIAVAPAGALAQRGGWGGGFHGGGWGGGFRGGGW